MCYFSKRSCTPICHDVYSKTLTYYTTPHNCSNRIFASTYFRFYLTKFFSLLWTFCLLVFRTSLKHSPNGTTLIYIAWCRCIPRCIPGTYSYSGDCEAFQLIIQLLIRVCDQVVSRSRSWDQLVIVAEEIFHPPWPSITVNTFWLYGFMKFIGIRPYYLDL